MDVYDRLRQDHDDLRGLLAKLDQPDALREFGRAELFRAVYMKLSVHSEAEETVYYDAVRTNPAVADLIAESFAEHQDVIRRLEDARAIPPESDRWLESMREIRSRFLHHASQEENTVFPKTQSFLPESKAEEMGENFRLEEVRIFGEERQRL